MAFSRYRSTHATSNLLAASSRENADILGKAGLGKPTLVNTHRTTLGNLGNRNISTLQNAKKALKENEDVKPRGVTTRAAAQKVLAKAKTEQEVVKVHKEEVKPVSPKKSAPSPSLMDISNNTQGEEAFSKQLLHVENIDKDDHNNPQLVSEYVNDIYHYLRELEIATPVKPRYLEGSEINGRMRSILIDWLVQVHLRFHLLQETLYLTVAIIDRFLQAHEVSKNKLQLVGVTAMLLASKYEEMYAPEINDFVYITDNAYTKSDIRKMECVILKKLDFNLGRPLPLHFLRRNSKAGEVDAQKHTLAKYFMELTIVDYDSVHYTPSQVAAAALCLSMKILDETPKPWSSTLMHYSCYSEDDLLPVMRRMCHLLQRAGTGKLTAIKTKYQSSKFMRISSDPQLKCALVEEMAVAAVSSSAR